MSSNGEELKNMPLRQDIQFNWIFLVELILCGVLTLFFLFYFNRAFAAVLSYGLRSWTWHKYKVYIDIKSFQISLLAGRVFFKGFRYHGSNETIIIQSGYITWQYWLRNFKHLGLDRNQQFDPSGASQNNVGGGQGSNDLNEDYIPPLFTSLPCRLIVSLKGVEWFIYNRSPAYDAIIDAVTTSSNREDSENVRQENNTHSEQTPHEKYIRSESTIHGSNCSDSSSGRPTSRGVTHNLHSLENELNKLSTASQSERKKNVESPVSEDSALILKILPIQIECEKAAIVIGNRNTKSILITKIDKAEGKIDASNAPSKLDLFRQFINLHLDHPVIQIKSNQDFRENNSTSGSRADNGDHEMTISLQESSSIFSFFRQYRRKAWHRLRDIVPAFRSSVNSLSPSISLPERTFESEPSSHWQGLSRYLDDGEQDEKCRWSSIDYANVSNIFESLSTEISLYWDVVGSVQKNPNHPVGSNFTNNINGETAPEWGVNLSIGTSTINYGPWADRQRVDIQKVFFPSLCKDSIPSKMLNKGQLRIPVEFKLKVEIDEDSVLRVPIKEDSKNWRWINQAKSTGASHTNSKGASKHIHKSKSELITQGPEARPFGWLDLKVGANSVLRYCSDTIAGSAGFSSQLDIDLPTLEITTSVNHGLLWKSNNNRICCDLSNPLQWNGLRNWKFDVSSHELELFILREHIFLLTDLVDDWTSGPSPDYLTFCPFKYSLNIHLHDFKFFFNVNDSNIINVPSDFDDNTFIIFFGETLDSNIIIPLNLFRPQRNEVSFEINIRHGGLNLLVPPWNTQATFLTEKELAAFKKLFINGKYQYFSTVSPSNTDILLLDMCCQSLSARFYGFAIRYLLKLRDNYFGEDIQFKTLEEYQEVINSGKENKGCQPPSKKSNGLDIIFGFSMNICSLILPSNIYSTSDSTHIEIINIASDIRFTNYYMDFGLDFGTIAFSQGSEHSSLTNQMNATSSTQLFIDGLNVFGNRLFGLPPTEPTYICNWDFSIGAVTGECTTEFLRRLSSGLKAFVFSYNDDENAIPSISELILHDVTFFRASIESVNLWLHVEQSALFLMTEKISVSFNDWAGSYYAKNLNISIPGMKFGCVNAESASRHKSIGNQSNQTDALIQTTISLVMVEKNLGFERDRELQQEHLKKHDHLTRRSGFLYEEYSSASFVEIPVDPPTMKCPPLPAPVFLEEFSNDGRLSRSKSASFNKEGRKSSFISLENLNTTSTSNKYQHLPHDSSTQDVPRSKLRSNVTKRGVPSNLWDRTTHKEEYSFKPQRPYLEGLNNKSQSTPELFSNFSNSYMEPYFPMESIMPDTSELPESYPEYTKHLPLLSLPLCPDYIPWQEFNDKNIQTSYVLSFHDGIRGFSNPTAVRVMTGLLNTFQNVSPIDLLDEIQIDSIGEVLRVKNKDQLETAIDFKLHLPYLNLRFLQPLNFKATKGTRIKTHDQFDLSMVGLDITYRSESPSNDAKKNDDDNSFKLCTSIFSANLAAKERFHDMVDVEIFAHFTFENLTFWANFRNEHTAIFRLKSLEFVTSCRKVEHLISLLHRTEIFTNICLKKLETRSRQQQNRLKLFTYLVATAGEKVSEPLFLTRPSYVLRSAPCHLRTKVSWAIIARLRHMYNSLDPSSQRDIGNRSSDNKEEIPQDAQQRMLVGLSTWRNWDLKSMDKCMVIKKIYGDQGKNNLVPILDRPVTFLMWTGAIQLIIDPGPEQNTISISDITINFKINKLFKGDNNLQLSNDSVSLITIRIFIASISMCLNWELCEMAKDVLRLIYQNKNIADQASLSGTLDRSEGAIRDDAYTLHIILVTEKASIDLDTINIRVILFSKEIEASLTTINNASQTSQENNSLIVTSNTASSKIMSHSQELSVLQFQKPRLYASLQIEKGFNLSECSLKLAASCQEFELIISQPVVALIEVIDLVVVDEIAQIYELMRIGSSEDHHKLDKGTGSPKVVLIPKVNIAVFSEKYQVTVPLLRFLTYTVFGDIVRSSIDVQDSSEIAFDFDINGQSHEINISTDRNKSSVSMLETSPINGRIMIHISEKQTLCSIFASVEPLIVDAAVFHTLLTAIIRPEVSGMISDMQNDVANISVKLKNVFSADQQIKNHDLALEKPWIYNAHLTLAGFRIFANALGVDKSQKSTRIDLNLGCVQLIAMNQVGSKNLTEKCHEFRISLHQIVFELARWNSTATEPCGNFSFAAFVTIISKVDKNGQEVKSSYIKSNNLKINLFADTASSILEVLGHLQDKIKDIDFSREKHYLRKFRDSKSRITSAEIRGSYSDIASSSSTILESMYSLELLNVQISWLVGTSGSQPHLEKVEDLVLSLKRMNLSTRKQNSAQLRIEDLQLQMVPTSQDKIIRSLNSALLPEIIFNVGHISTDDSRRLAFQASGKSLDLRLTSQFIIPASATKNSIISAAEKFREASALWNASDFKIVAEPQKRQPILGQKRLESLLIDADFAGAMVHLSGKNGGVSRDETFAFSPLGKHESATNSDTRSSINNTTLCSPGLACKIEYRDNGVENPSVNAEIKVNASSNILYPSVVPLVLEISSTVKNIVSDEDNKFTDNKTEPQESVSVDDNNILTSDPSAVLGRTRLNLGLRIYRQEFCLSCQPIARVAATAQFEDIYIAVNTVQSKDHGYFFAASAAVSKLKASVQHVYSREATGSFYVEKVFLSLMNSRHISTTSGLSAILQISPMSVIVNAKQVQDFLLFREIWMPPEIRQKPSASNTPPSAQQLQTILVQRYQEVAATRVFPWNATVSIAELDVQLDLGQAIGKSSFLIANFWLSSKKNSAWEQNLCLGISKLGVECTGRMSGFFTLQDFKLRTSIHWPSNEMVTKTPLIQGSMNFSKLSGKAAFDYHTFLIADIASLQFLMYNVRNNHSAKVDQLVAFLEGESVHIFSTATAASQALALYQAFQKLIQEKRTNFETSLSEIEKFLERRFISQTITSTAPLSVKGYENKSDGFRVSLHTRVTISLKSVNIGAFPNTFSDYQVFKLETLGTEARFAVSMDNGKIHCSLGLTLGQLCIGLASIKEPDTPQTLGDICVEDIIKGVTGSRGGTILKVPKVEATMETWQIPKSNDIDYIFKSFFEGKVEVGWNYSRISYIRSMWTTHSKALVQKLGKPLPPSAVRIIGDLDDEKVEQAQGGRQKIRAEVNVPQSKYNYSALEPSIIETPQLRDMGEATPPLEWIGLHRDRLPNLTHQIVIVTLLELAREVENTYEKILGSS
ncbi:BgTH12-04033 [Blumeria graminis f. sp. triticale]|uniref:BgTH12-04033 n=1 Tax=Blumeria graminis f. sp. triticale TaxID=1689686 RepID=A0A9W4GD03_BLUGR|nr:BgTH12-04033 [Blumeria graminis f. sp. triticale]